MAFQPSGAIAVRPFNRVLPAVNLHHELRLLAEKVGDVAADRVLAPELDAVEPPVA